MRDHPRSLPITPDLAALVGDSWVGASLEGSAASTGTHELIREGTATIATSIEDIAQGAERVIPMADFAVGVIGGAQDQERAIESLRFPSKPYL